MLEHRAAKMRRCRCRKLLCIISGCPAGARKWHIAFLLCFCIAKKHLSSHMTWDERRRFRGTTQLRGHGPRTRFPLTEDDPSAHFLAAAPGRTPQHVSGRLAAGGRPSLGDAYAADLPVHRICSCLRYHIAPKLASTFFTEYRFPAVDSHAILNKKRREEQCAC